MFAPPAFPRSEVRRFGRREPFVEASPASPGISLAADARLFLLSFVGGLIFMTVYLA